MTRRFWVIARRYVGLYMAVFLTVAALAGSVLAFDAQINNWLNPGLNRVPVQCKPMLDGFTARELALAIEPRARINFVPLNIAPGDVYYFALEPNMDAATGKPFDLGYVGCWLKKWTSSAPGLQNQGQRELNKGFCNGISS